MSQVNEIHNKTTEKTKQEQIFIHLIVGFREICIVTAALPLVTLVMCFITAYIFQSEEIHETHCRVYNVIPSISAITGVSPQRYFWRACIAFHIGPRVAIAAVYRNYYGSLVKRIRDPKVQKRTMYLVTTVFVLNLIEIGALCGVTYVSNRENYPIHEKVFITFMICSLCHMLATIRLNESTAKISPAARESAAFSLYCKKILFFLSIASTIGLVLFFLKHRFLCHDMAFSWFALCEYIIASANMGFHCTTMLDFPTEHFIVARGAETLKNHHEYKFE
ncbi:post-GPI attachment to proteins factor 2-like [Lutzomyia longipalpis]|uniref:post-GPI attachment to proteins factor 2-like n=1 Tax=Lutzomyia longipalpis TaxID=7200 RepID=UPI0024837946|nr:post-GPI attachment to proteins factor 2-like [Lutzomyia longipalpis]